MTVSKYKKIKIEKLKKEARQLYKQGLSVRRVGAIIGKSHEWVAKAVKEKLTGLDKLK